MKSGFTIVLILGLCISTCLIIAGCSQSSSTVPTTTTIPASTPTAQAATTGTAGMANPASVNCVNVGGQSVIMTNPDGSQYGMCNFTNGTSCEEWALFRGEGCQPGVNANQTGMQPRRQAIPGMANPASANCVNVGGTVQIKDSPASHTACAPSPMGPRVKSGRSSVAKDVRLEM